MNAAIYILFYTLIAQAQHGIAARLEISIFACVALALLWGAVPVRAVAFNDQHSGGECEITKKLTTNYILEFIRYSKPVKRLHKARFDAGRAGRLQCNVTDQGMLHRFYRVFFLPIAYGLAECCAARFIAFPLQLYRLAAGAARYIKIGHEPVNSAGIRKATCTRNISHMHACTQPPLYTSLQRLAQRSLGLGSEVTPPQFMAAIMRAGQDAHMAIIKFPAANRTIPHSNVLFHTSIIAHPLYSGNCTRAFAPIVE